MASQSQGEGDINDQRFAELLKPIKDLTQNWEVRLADILSEYIEDLQHVTITLDGGKTSINFAQAALVLQGTAAVWSKKVDFLWQMVLKTMEMLQNKKEGDEEGEGEAGGGGGKARGKKTVDLTKEFTLLTLELANNIDVRGDDVETLEERKAALNFIYITPRQLIEKEGSEQKAVKVSLYMGLNVGKPDILAAKEDFRINSQYNSVRGKLGDELTEESLQEVDLSEVEQLRLSIQPRLSLRPSMSDFDAIGRLSNQDGGSAELPSIPEDEHEMEVDDGGEHLGDVSLVSVKAAGQHLSACEPPECLASPRIDMSLSTSCLPPQDVTPEPAAPAVDPWLPLDPHALMATPKPLVARKQVRFPPSIRAKHKAEKTGKPVPPLHLPPIREYFQAQMVADIYKPNSLPKVPPALYDLAVEQVARRKEARAQRRKELQEANNRKRDALHLPRIQPPDEDEIDDDVFFNDDRGHHEDDNDGVDHVDIEDMELPNPHLGGDVGAVVIDEVPLEEEEDSYEALVAKKVAQFVQQSQEYLHSSELTKRVAHWHEMIGPRLEAVERRKAHDVHAYGSVVLDHLEALRPRDPIHFNEIFRGYSKAEVPRYFLSTLMLCNTMNVRVSLEPGTHPELGMDNVMLSLLSTTRHHQQLEDFQAASQGGENLPAVVENQHSQSMERIFALPKGKRARKKKALHEVEEDPKNGGKSPPAKKGRKKKKADSSDEEIEYESESEKEEEVVSEPDSDSEEEADVNVTFELDDSKDSKAKKSKRKGKDNDLEESTEEVMPSKSKRGEKRKSSVNGDARSTKKLTKESLSKRKK